MQDNDMMSIMLNQFKELNKRFDNNEKIFETKFNVMSSDMNSRFDTNEKELNKRFDINNAKFDVLTKSLCSIESKLSEICSETKRETNESRECVCCLLYTSRCV